MSYDIDLLVDVPGATMEEVVDVNFEGDGEVVARGVDLPGMAAELRSILSERARIESSETHLSAFDSMTGLQMDLTYRGGQINLPLEPASDVMAQAVKVAALATTGTGLVAFDPQSERPFLS